MSVYDYITEAQAALHRVHSCMIDALGESQKDSNRDNWISSADFAELNALGDKLDDLAKRYAPPEEPLTLSSLFGEQNGESDA